MVKKLGKLDCAYNKIKTIEKAFGRDVNLVQLSMDHNLIEELPRDENGSFCGYADVESFSTPFSYMREVMLTKWKHYYLVLTNKHKCMEKQCKILR